ncbi:ferrous iron transport protein A, partial [Pseudomonas sp. BGM005]|nr:ferrous iron transport protein A [Pseudomonas sp. BG5]
RPRFDPHGDAIPDATGAVKREPFVLLADAPTGHVGRVLRVDDRDPELLRALEAAGVIVAATVATTASGIALDGTPIDLPDGAAEVVWL